MRRGNRGHGGKLIGGGGGAAVIRDALPWDDTFCFADIIIFNYIILFNRVKARKDIG